MPSMDVTKVIGDAGNTVSMLADQQYEVLPYDAMVEVAVVAEATSAADKAVVTIYSGSDLLVQDGAVETAANNLPGIKYPDNFLYTDAAFAGEKLSVLVRSTGAGTSARVVVRITPA